MSEDLEKLIDLYLKQLRENLLVLYQENRYPKTFVDGVYCGIQDSISTLENILEKFYDQDLNRKDS